MSSLSSQLISGITYFRNPNGAEQDWALMSLDQRKIASWIKVAMVEPCYLAVIPLAIVETALSAVAKTFSCLLPLNKERHESLSNWFYSSFFSIGWALSDSAINLVANDMIVTEDVARRSVASGHLLHVPLAAL